MNSVEAIALATRLKERPWCAESFQIDFPSMIFPEEQRLLYHLGRHVFRGDGDVVDLGAFLGGSTVCLAAGLEANPTFGDRKLHSFDMFVCPSDGFSQTLIQSGKKPGDSVLDLYQKHLGDHARSVRVYEGDVTRMHYRGGPVEILFNDVAKTHDVNDHLIRTYFANTTGIGAVIIQQDYNTPWLPWVQVTSSVLRPYTTFVADIHGTRLYVQTQDIPTEAIQRCLSTGTTPDERQKLIRMEADTNESTYSRAICLLAQAWMAFIDFDSVERGHSILDGEADFLSGVTGVPEQMQQMRDGMTAFRGRAGYEKYHEEYFPNKNG